VNQFKSEFGCFNRERAAKVNCISQIRKGNLVVYPQSRWRTLPSMSRRLYRLFKRTTFSTNCFLEADGNSPWRAVRWVSHFDQRVSRM